MINNTFTCSICNRTFEKGRSDEAAMEESVSKFGEHSDDDLAVICDDCYNQIKGYEILKDLMKDLMQRVYNTGRI